MEYICVKKCFFRNRMYREGTVAHFQEGVIPPHHFKTCDGSPMPEPKKPRELSEKEIQEREEVGRLRLILDELGRAYDRRWGSEKLQIEIDKANKGMIS